MPFSSTFFQSLCISPILTSNLQKQPESEIVSEQKKLIFVGIVHANTILQCYILFMVLFRYEFCCGNRSIRSKARSRNRIPRFYILGQKVKILFIVIFSKYFRQNRILSGEAMKFPDKFEFDQVALRPTEVLYAAVCLCDLSPFQQTHSMRCIFTQHLSAFRCYYTFAFL